MIEDNKKSNRLVHGGDIYRNKVKLDFSVNINPLGLPEKVKQTLIKNMECLENYPDPICSNLIKKIGENRKCREEYVLCGNGASEVFQMVVLGVRPKKAILLSPSFSGYEYALSQTDCEIEYFELKEQEKFQLKEEFLEKLTLDLDMVFLCNPNNPVGNCIEMDLLQKIAGKCQELEICLIIDECFLEFHGDYETKTMMPFLEKYKNIILVNAFTKIYAMPGIRLGYAVCADRELLSKMKRMQAEWSVSVLAQIAGIAALQEKEYIEKSKELVEVERDYLIKELCALGLLVFPSESSFILWKGREDLQDKLLEKGILIRDCSNYRGLSKGYFRTSVKCHKENRILIENLKKCF